MPKSKRDFFIGLAAGATLALAVIFGYIIFSPAVKFPPTNGVRAPCLANCDKNWETCDQGCGTSISCMYDCAVVQANCKDKCPNDGFPDFRW